MVTLNLSNYQHRLRAPHPRRLHRLMPLLQPPLRLYQHIRIPQPLRMHLPLRITPPLGLHHPLQMTLPIRLHQPMQMRVLRPPQGTNVRHRLLQPTHGYRCWAL